MYWGTLLPPLWPSTPLKLKIKISEQSYHPLIKSRLLKHQQPNVSVKSGTKIEYYTKTKRTNKLKKEDNIFEKPQNFN